MAHVGSEVRYWRDRSFGFWFLHIGVPVALLAAALAADYAGGAVKEFVLNPYTGAAETLVGIGIISSAVIVAFILARATVEVDWKLKTWLVLFILAMIFFAGEDLNWGQHYFGWTPPDYFLEHNREEETNIHNMWPLLFNRLPRGIVNAWLIVACILVPLGWRWPVSVLRNVVPPVLWPDRRLMFPASMVFAIKGLRHVSSNISEQNWLLGVRHSELEELMIMCVLIFYALMLWERLVKRERVAAAV